MVRGLDDVSLVLTSFVHQEGCFTKLREVMASVREHHPRWSIVTGKGSASRLGLSILEVECPFSESQWKLPIAVHVDGGAHDGAKVDKLKAWWIAEVWHTFGYPAGRHRRVLWIDPNVRLQRPLTFTLDPEQEAIAGDWDSSHYQADPIRGQLLLFQGTSYGAVEAILDQWSQASIAQIKTLEEASINSSEEDQQLAINKVLGGPSSNEDFARIHLGSSTYCAGLDKKEYAA